MPVFKDGSFNKNKKALLNSKAFAINQFTGYINSK